MVLAVRQAVEVVALKDNLKPVYRSASYLASGCLPYLLVAVLLKLKPGSRPWLTLPAAGMTDAKGESENKLCLIQI